MIKYSNEFKKSVKISPNEFKKEFVKWSVLEDVYYKFKPFGYTGYIKNLLKDICAIYMVIKRFLGHTT